MKHEVGGHKAGKATKVEPMHKKGSLKIEGGFKALDGAKHHGGKKHHTKKK